ncbi:MAG TPA: TonB-dependent receptor [Rhodocyclaceae bacterium]|uniref:TonB-dependent receptor plug domain-containing protein n=1 Tax=Zoogloea sp. TaxID=49181 RepID=UPI002BB42254|nr:TonB-dependent receptor [Zoogloea sp.]HMV18403.1 TonB-dependent receptor [Rhodocyclaceae bacterium]HMV63806.1 TonB-dependent receptor [Rhodocyclaceae bacterium]HMZ75701.1 TonB-dependent receptor [Rhodocyclaceae bacterium]HNA68359.1 TonB-dependent receptor [Rhodocyclaceae bacterium]HNB66107.1 TonB-dependent receptor [Rhodocyclaceae bacterium]
MSLFRPPAGVLLALAGLVSGAAVHASPEESPFFEDMPTVLSASRLPEPLHEAPGAVTVLDRDFIRATGYRDVARLLRLVPGMQVGQERGHAQWVTYHGLGSDYPTEIQVLIDGRSVFAPSSFGGVNWSGLPLTVEEIERIEVVRGTNSNAYGANAFLGVVNIITRHSRQDPGGHVEANAGTHRIGDLAAAWAGGDERIGVRLSAAALNDDGFGSLFDGRHTGLVSLRSDLRASTRDELTLRAGFADQRRDLGYPDSVFGNNAQRTSTTHNGTLHLIWRHTDGPDEEWMASLYRNHESGVDRWNASAPPAYPSVPLDRNVSSMRTNAEFQHRFALGPSTRLVWGLEGRRDETDADTLFAGLRPPGFELYRAFSNLAWHATPAWQINLGALLEKSPDTAAQFIPRAFVNWQASATDTFRAGYARAWEQRNLFDRYGDVRAYDPVSRALLAWPYMPNPAARVPKVDTLELGYLGRFRALDATVDVRLFNERITDFVIREVIDPPMPVALPLRTSRFVNLPTPVVLRGVETQWRLRPARDTELLINHTLIDRRADDATVTKRTAPYVASLTWLQQYGGGWSSTASLLRMGPLAGGYGFVPGCDYAARAYTTVDLRLARRFTRGGRQIEVALNGINLGAPHQEIADRSEQCLPAHLGTPVNPASPMGWLSLAVAL